MLFQPNWMGEAHFFNSLHNCTTFEHQNYDSKLIKSQRRLTKNTHISSINPSKYISLHFWSILLKDQFFPVKEYQANRPWQNKLNNMHFLSKQSILVKTNGVTLLYISQGPTKVVYNWNQCPYHIWDWIYGGLNFILLTIVDCNIQKKCISNFEPLYWFLLAFPGIRHRHFCYIAFIIFFSIMRY